MKTYKYEIGLATDKGNKRAQNQDSLIAIKGTMGKNDFVLLAVADGMGGLNKGEIASQTAILNLKQWWDTELINIIINNDYINIIDSSLNIVLDNINNEILSIKDTEHKSSGTTLSLIFIHKNKYILKHIGDSRIYVFNNKKITQITNDHTWCAKEIEKGNLTMEEAQNHGMKHVLLNALGIGQSFEVQTQKGKLLKNSKVLLCSDGLYNYITSNEIINFVFQRDNPQNIVSDMMNFVKESEANDNISAILLETKTKWTVTHGYT